MHLSPALVIFRPPSLLQTHFMVTVSAGKHGCYPLYKMTNWVTTQRQWSTCNININNNNEYFNTKLNDLPLWMPFNVWKFKKWKKVLFFLKARRSQIDIKCLTLSSGRRVCAKSMRGGSFIQATFKWRLSWEDWCDRVTWLWRLALQ